MAAVIALALAWGGYKFYSHPPPQPNSEPREITVYLSPGMPLANVAVSLHEAGVVRDPLLFKWGVTALGAARHLKAGEYALSNNSSMSEVMDLLVAGKTLLRSFTIPEGLTTAEVGKVLQSAEGLTGEMPEDAPEGWLLPETYMYQRGDSRTDVMAQMKDAMTRAVDRLWSTRKPDLPFDTPLEALVLASIIEKETSVPAERAQVAGVFINRLRRGMRLQSDPTVVYAHIRAGRIERRALTFDDLNIDSPFNTYKIRGLPPGPIANAGQAAIEAALRPEDTDALYFVADGTGGHVFAKSLKEHRKNVRRWRALKTRR